MDWHFPLTGASRSAMIDQEFLAMRHVYLLGDPVTLDLPFETISLILNKNLAQGNTMFRLADEDLFRSRGAIDTSAYTYQQLAAALNQDDNWFKTVLGTRLWVQFLELSQSFYDLSLLAFLVARGRMYKGIRDHPRFVRFGPGDAVVQAPAARNAELRNLLYNGRGTPVWEQVDWNDWPQSPDMDLQGGDGKFDEGTPSIPYWRSFIALHPPAEQKMAEPLPWYVVFPRMSTSDLSLELMEMRGDAEWGLLDDDARFDNLIQDPDFGL